LLALLFAALSLFARQLVEAGASAALGREVQIAGDFDVRYSLAPQINAGSVTLSNPDWSQHPDMLTVQALTLAIDLRALLHGRLVFPELRLQSPVLILEKTVQGPANWQFGANGGEHGAADGRSQWMPSIEHLSVSEGRIIYYSSGGGRQYTMTVGMLEAQAASGQPATVSARGVFNGVTYTLDASGAPVDTVMNSAASAYPFSLHVETEVGDLQAEGGVSAPLASAATNIHWTVKGDSLAALLPAGAALAGDPGYLLRGRLRGKGGGNWALADFHAEFGQTLVRGSMALDTSGKKPFLRANLSSPRADVDLIEGLVKTFTGAGGKGHGDAGPAPGRLDLADARVRLSVDRIINAGLPMENLLLESSLANGRLTVDPFRVAVGSGQLLGSLDLDVAAPAPNGQVTVQFDQVPVVPLLQLLPYGVTQKGVLDGRLTLAFSSDTLGKAAGRLRYSAPASNTLLELDLSRRQVADQGWQVDLGISGVLSGASVDGEFSGQPLMLVAGSGASPLALDLSVGDYRLQIDGQAAGAGARLDLKVTTSGPGTQKLSRLLGVHLPVLPSYAISAEVTRTPGLFELDGLTARIGKSRFTGTVALDRSGRRNMVRVELDAGLLAYADFDQLMTGGGRFPEIPKWLDETDARIDLSADRVVGPKNAVYRQMALQAFVGDGRMHVAPLRFTAGGGTVTASGVLNQPDSGRAAASLHAKVAHVRLSEALKPFGLGRRFPGLLDADIDFTTDPDKPGGDSTLRYRDAGAGTDIRLKLFARPDRMQIMGRGRYLHDQFQIDGTAGPASGLVGSGHYPFDIEFKALETNGQLSGTIAQPLKLNGLTSTLAIRGPNPRRAEPALGFRMPELPPYSLNGTLTRQNSMWGFADIRGEVGNTDLSGWIRVDHTDSKPRVTATLHSDLLDLDDLGGVIGAAPGDGPGEVISPQQKVNARQNRARGTMLPDQEFEFPSFLGFGADVRYSATRVDSDRLPLDSLQLTFRVEDGRLRLSPLLVGAGGGVVRMNLRLVDRPAERPVHGHVTFDISRVSAAKLLRPFDIARGSAGLISGHGQFSTSGESVAAMMASMNGEASLAMNTGRLNASLVELAGLDGGEALLLGLGKRQTVDVTCAYIGSTVRRGKLGFDTAVVDTTDTRFTMTGSVDLAREHFDVRLLAHPKDMSLFAARAPLLLEGTFRDPDFHPSWGSLLARGAVALALGAITPPAALLAFVEPGLGEAAAPCRNSLPQ
jgi:uncharacterized protein involved in outer membrane biogenesis